MSASPQRHRPLSGAVRTATVLAAGLSLAFEGGFRGCGSESSPSPGVLPPGDPLECVADSDCEAPMCRDARCVVGRCEVFDVMIDADFDGFVGAPCGTDCDDANSAVSPGAFEACDGFDNDCDGMVDDGAPPTVQVYEVAAAVQAVAGREDLPGVLLLSTTPIGDAFELEARWLDLGVSAAFAIETVAELPADDAIVVAISTSAGARILWASATERAIREASIEVEHTGASVVLTVSPASTVLDDVDVTAMQAVETASGYALLLERVSPMSMERERALLIPGALPIALPYRDALFDIAARDTRFYVPSWDQELAVIDATGVELSRVVLPGTFAADAVTSWNGRLFVTSSDFSDYSVRELGPADEIGDGWALTDSSTRGADIALHPLGRTLGVTRASWSGIELLTYEETGVLVEYQWAGIASSTGVFRQRTLLETSVGLALVATRSAAEPSSSAVALVGCRTTP